MCTDVFAIVVTVTFVHMLILFRYYGSHRIEHRIRQQIVIDDMQFGFMKGKGTTDAGEF